MQTDPRERSLSFKGNAYVSILIEETQLVTSLSTIQNDIVGQYPDSEASKVPPESFHITLIAFHYKYRTEIKAKLAEAVAAAMKLKAELLGTHLDLRLISSNGFRVMVKVQDGRAQLMSLVVALREELEKVDGVTIDPKWKRFSPHVSLFTDNFNRFRIPEKVLSPHRNNESVLGCQTVNSVQLLSMKRSMVLNGNYEKLTEDIYFNAQDVESVDMTKKISLEKLTVEEKS